METTLAKQGRIFNPQITLGVCCGRGNKILNFSETYIFVYFIILTVVFIHYSPLNM